ncbi:MAG: ATPase, T2SS/T4P/T4SS family [Pseudomonadota bacterium]|nr:ATPase, T2SS/T4P/T4SS family [Pseudomonadota bacterium]
MADGSGTAYCWPSPPFAAYPQGQPQSGPLACSITGLNDKLMHGQLTALLPEQGVALVQLPPSRTNVPLRFDQFRSLCLTQPLTASDVDHDDAGALSLAPGAATPFRLTWSHGGELLGSSLGHVRTALGLFLFPPVEGDPKNAAQAVTRMFIPAAAFSSFELGGSIGEVLVAQRAATPQQIEQAAEQQARLRSQKIGGILVTRNIVTPEQLLLALDQQARMPMVRIGEALMSLNLISEAELQDALAQQQHDRSVPLGEILVRNGVVSRADLQVAMARKMGYPLVDVDAFPVDSEALRKLPYAVATRLRVLPLLMCESRVVIAIDDPARLHTAVEEAEFSMQMKVLPVLAQSRSIDLRIDAVYEQIGAIASGRYTGEFGQETQVLEPMGTDQLVENLERENDNAFHDDRPIEQSDNSLVRLINNMIIEAYKDGVSDIHIESYPGREKIRIRFRKDGVLRTYLELPPNYRSSLIARIKIMCDLDISERRKPQDGKINFARFSSQHRIELRVATIPTNNSLEDVVMRILVSARPIPLEQLGMSAHNLAQLKAAIERPYGMVLCVGPTGSGKTTTLHSALASINLPQRKIWTAEDPIEITQPGLRQVQVNPRIDWTFAKALRAFLRADPDVIMVGEIRDEETAHMAIEASLTGHLVLSTLHTNSAPETVTRLLDMGMDPFNFADSLLAVLGQRLVRKLCGECRQSRPATEAEIDELLDDYLNAFAADASPFPDRDAVRAQWIDQHGQNGRLQMHHSPGCAHCDHTGFKGRAGLHELMVISRNLRRMVQTGERAEALQQVALREGMRTLRQDGIDKVLAGITTIEDVRAMSNA